MHLRPRPARKAASFSSTRRMEPLRFGPCHDLWSNASSNSSRMNAMDVCASGFRMVHPEHLATLPSRCQATVVAIQYAEQFGLHQMNAPNTNGPTSPDSATALREMPRDELVKYATNLGLEVSEKDTLESILAQIRIRQELLLEL